MKTRVINRKSRAESENANKPAATDGARPAQTAAILESQVDAVDAAMSAPPGAAKDLLRKWQRMERLRAQQELAQAERLRQEAREIAQRVREKTKFQRALSRHQTRVESLAQKLGYDPARPITEIPAIDSPRFSQVDFQPIRDGVSYVRILYDTLENSYFYEVLEPKLNNNERSILAFITDTLIRTLEGRPVADEEASTQFLMDAIERAILDHSILVDETSKQRLVYHLLRDFLGYGRIDAMIRDPMIEDISCDGPDIPVYVFHRQYESIRSNVKFTHALELDSYVIRLAQRCAKHISIADPLLDATLPDGSRLQASLAKEVTTRGSSFTIRRFRSDPLTPPDLVKLGTMSPEVAAYFWLAMEDGNSILFGGGTASGKTTSLNACSLFIPPQKKIVSIEDTREINLIHENWIAGLTRTGFTGEMLGAQLAGAIDMYRLLEAALRQRPEYLIVGEVRGPEAVTLFQAMATGHATYSTVHGDSVASVVYRLENPPINVPRIMLQTLNIVAIQSQIRVNDRPTRRMKEVVEILGIDPSTGDLLTNTVFEWRSAGDRYVFRGKSHMFDRIRTRRNMTAEEVEEEWRRRAKIIEWMLQKGIRNITDVSGLVGEYYRRPNDVLARVGIGGDRPAR